MTLLAFLLEDAHPGSGSGGAGVDALVARDQRGWPVIWASHVEGILRDAARRLRGEDFARGFFGQSGGQRQRTVFTSLYADSDPASRVWRSSARTAFDNRAPREDTLRAVEYVPKGTSFSGQVEILESDLPFLRRLVQEVDALGSGRASGAGRVKLELHPATVRPCAVGNARSRLIFLLRSLEPLCITATARPDNLIPSLPFVPGRAILGSLAGWLVAEGYCDAAALLVNGCLSVSDALPIPNLPKRLLLAEVLPAPLSLQSEKPEGSAGLVPWWADAPTPVKRLNSHSDEARQFKLKRPERDLFIYRSTSSDSWIAFHPQLRVRLRNGRPEPDRIDPQLFAIEQIAEGTCFLCEVRGAQTDMDRLSTALKPVLEGMRWLRVGRGGAPVEVAQIEWSDESPPITPSSPAILTLTSDLLIRDEYLRWCRSINEARFRQCPGWPEDVRVLSAIQDTAAVHGFNGTSRLWRMPAYGIRRGSVFEVEGKGVAELACRIAAGKWLGERTHEGFGRFRLDSSLPGVTIEAPGSMTAQSAASGAVTENPDEVIASTTRQWFDAHRTLAEMGSSSEKRPSLSQWLDLVSSLERQDPDALKSRLTPTTAGGRNWEHPDAKMILNELIALKAQNTQAVHARFFVRWLRAEMQKGTV